MGNLVKLAACFSYHHKGEEELIPASIEHPDPLCEWETVVYPIIGFMAISYLNRISWSFIKYEAPDGRYKTRWSEVPTFTLSRIGTTRVGHVSCPACGNSCLLPVWGRPMDVRCPVCGHKGQYVSFVKAGSGEFFELLGELKAPLEKAVKSVNEKTAKQFRFPNLLLQGNVFPSSSVNPVFQRQAARIGFSLRIGTESSTDELFSPAMGGPGTALFLEPGIVTGVLDADRAREGWVWQQGVVTQSVRLPWLPKPPLRPKRFEGVRL